MVHKILVVQYLVFKWKGSLRILEGNGVGFIRASVDILLINNLQHLTMFPSTSVSFILVL